MLKKVAILDGEIISVIHSDEELDYFTGMDGVKFDEREMYYSVERGWWEAETLSDIKQEKARELDIACRDTILGRFKAIVDGTEYGFSYDMEAQSRFTGTAVLFLANKITDIEWTAYQNGERVRIVLNSGTFDIVSLAALQHQNANIVKYNQLLQQVNNATTKEQVGAIVW
ncbi:hypothetical protein [Lysinibacillus sp. LZ02]|uniref:DUF4376 domain-containing protein n=1 Tax=Lysinibacillus sp. LZ02 TaxID=3420668 RepID=UPI003D359B7B